MKIFVADVGGTFIKYAVMNESAEIFERGKIPTPLESHEKFLQKLFELYKSSGGEGIAISLPGIIDVNRGLCVTSGAIDHNCGKFLVRELEELCKTNVAIENDANCAALAEAKIGSLSDVDAGFVAVFGTGVGGAFVKGGKVYHGKNNLAGEVGFIFSEVSKDFSVKKIFSEVGGVPYLLNEFAQKKNLSAEKISGEDFFQAVEQKDFDAVNLLENFTLQIAIHIFNIQLVLDPEKFAIGGGISAQKIFIDKIRENLERVYKNCLVTFPRLEIVPCKFRNDANLIGALFNWSEKFLS